VAGSGELWERATRAKFLFAIADGTLPEDSFRRWLAQDYLFAKELTSFQAIAAAKMPRGPQKLLIRGLLALDQEMDWFETVAANRSLDLNAARHPVCRRYVDFLSAAAYSNPFQVLLAILYGVEVSYLVAWSSLGPEGPYAEFIQRWSNDRFEAYVRDLLAVSDQHQHPDQQQHFNEVLRHEADFWRMTWEG
jgi:thiaminase/transcriptional activator TenA